MNTTIAISTEIRDQIKEFGTKGETYDEILVKLLNNAKERQLQDLLMNTEDCMTVDEAIKKAKKQWQ
jgi:predicted CopG family antitoxin